MQTKNLNNINVILSLITAIILVLLFLKSIFNIDTGYDAGWYHLPFAARIWGIIPKESFLSEQSIEHRYNGFPLLAHFFQGLFWKVTGRIQATNLVSYFSLLIYVFFLRNFFKVPFYISTIALLAIPAVLTHSTTSFVDLPGNIGASIVIMVMYVFLSYSRLPKKQELLIIFLGAVMAANTKLHLTVLIGILYCVTVTRLAFLYFKYSKFDRFEIFRNIFLGLLASLLIFATPTKNLIMYGNPLYPIKVEVMGVVLNHKLTPDTYSEGSRPQKWLRSVFEIDTPEWSADQHNKGNSQYLDRAGGFFSVYVISNLLLLITLTVKEYTRNKTFIKKDQSHAIIALVIMLFSSFFMANFPQSHELRYLMFWMISLVSINLSLIFSKEKIDTPWLKPKYCGLIYLVFFTIVCLKIDNYYLRPVFNPLPESYQGYTSVKDYMKLAVKPELVAKMLPNQRNCLIAAHSIPNPDKVPYASIANAIFYSSYFHPEVKYNYSIKAVTNPRGCGNLRKVP